MARSKGREWEQGRADGFRCSKHKILEESRQDPSQEEALGLGEGRGISHAGDEYCVEEGAASSQKNHSSLALKALGFP